MKVYQFQKNILSDLSEFNDINGAIYRSGFSVNPNTNTLTQNFFDTDYSFEIQETKKGYLVSAYIVSYPKNTVHSTNVLVERKNLASYIKTVFSEVLA